MNASEIIISQRERLKLNASEVAKASGLTIHEYEDLEDYDDEVISVVPLSKLKSVCRVLDLDILFLLGINPEFKASEKTFESCESLLRSAREKCGLSIGQVGDEIGIYDWSIAEVENDSSNLDKWVVEDIQALADVLDISAYRLIDR